jgi:hypothetical protein
MQSRMALVVLADRAAPNVPLPARPSRPVRPAHGDAHQAGLRRAEREEQAATIRIESRSKRGIAVKDVAVKTPGGYAIHDVWKHKGATTSQNMDGVSCDSPHGPWHIKISGDNGWSSVNAYYDITLDPNTGNGTLAGEEHNVTTDGHSSRELHVIAATEQECP